MLRLLLLILLFFVGIFDSRSANQDNSIYFTEFGIADGLPDDVMHMSVKDGIGNVWMLSISGLIRFDGNTFSLQNFEYNGKDLTNNIIIPLLVDDDGFLWISFDEDYVLGRYNPSKADFDFIPIPEELTQDTSKPVTALIGSSQNGYVYAEFNYDIPDEDQRQNKILAIHTNTLEIEVVRRGEEKLQPPNFSVNRLNWNYFEKPFHSVKDGTAWIGDKGQIFQFNKTQFEAITFPDEFSDHLVKSIVEQDGYIMLATDQGMLKYDIENERVEKMVLPDELQNQELLLLYTDQSDNLWISTKNGTWIYDEENSVSVSERREFAETDHSFLIPYVEDEGKIWFLNAFHIDAAFKRSNGFSIYDINSDTFEIWDESDHHISAADDISSLVLTDDGALIITKSGDKITLFTPRNKKFETYFTNPDYYDETRFREISNATESPDGLLLASTFESGIYIANPEKNQENNWDRLLVEGEEASAFNPVLGWHWIASDELLVATRIDGLFRIQFDPETLERNEVEHLPNDLWGGGTIRTFLFENEDEIVAASSEGIVKINLAQRDFQKIKYDRDVNNTRANDFSNFFYVDKKGRYWFYRNLTIGIRRYDPENEEIRNFLSDPSKDDIVYSVAGYVETSNGDLYAATDRQIMVWDEDSEEFRRIGEPFPSGITSITKFQNEMLLISNISSGFYIVDYEGNIHEHYSIQNGLPSNRIIDVFVHDENIWMIHNLGLSVLKPNGDFLHYWIHHGLTAAEKSDPSMFINISDDRVIPVFYGRGLSVFVPGDMPTLPIPAIPKFSMVSVDNESIKQSSIESIKIPHTARNVQLNISAFQFNDPSGTQYRYRFEGDQWSEWTNESEIRFFRLASGNYTLEAETRNSDLLISPQSAQMVITVTPPWFATIWAYIGYILIAGLLFYTGSKKYIQYKSERNRERMQAEQADKLAKIDALKTRLILNISHELRTPLTLVMAPIEQMQKKLANAGDDIKRTLQLARRNGKRLHELVEQVLDLARLEMKEVSFKVMPISANESTKRLVDYFESLVEINDITLTFTPLETDTEVFVDVDKFEKIIINLISNAIKFTEPGGKISVSLQKIDNQLQIKVSDTGRGISPDRLEKIFTRFESTEELDTSGSKGLGVGLSICKEYAELHKGEIQVQSELGMGSTFSLFLPLGTAHISPEFLATEIPEKTVVEKGGLIQADPDKLQEPKKTIPKVGAPRMLVIEDNDDLRSYIAEMFEDNYEVATAENGKEGVKLFAEFKPDLVVTDIMMPELDGFGVIEHIRNSETNQLTPIVILSARSELEDRIHGFEIGVNAYIAKPFSSDELLARVDNLLDLKSKRDDALEEYGDDVSEDPESELIQTLVAFVKDNISQSDITAEDLAGQIHQSRSNLYRYLKVSTGFTPAEFVRELRLTEADRILQTDKNIRISELGRMVGFSNSSYFSRLYKKRFGKSPKE